MTEQTNSTIPAGLLALLVGAASFGGSVAGIATFGIQIMDRLYYTASQGQALEARMAVQEAKIQSARMLSCAGPVGAAADKAHVAASRSGYLSNE